MSMRMIQKVFGFFGAKGGKGAHAEARRRGEERGMDFHHQTIQLSNHQTELSHAEARRRGEERGMDFHHQTIQLSNHQTGLSHAEARRDGGAETEKVVSRCGRRSSRGVNSSWPVRGAARAVTRRRLRRKEEGRRKKGGGQRANGPTIQRSNGQTVLRGRRFAAPWARAAAVALVAGGAWLGLLGGGLSSAWGAQETLSQADCSGKGTQTTGGSFTITQGDIRFAFTKSYGASGHVKLYSGATLTISSSAGSITEIVFTGSGSNYGTKLTTTSGSVSTSGKVLTWSGTANSVVFNNSTSGQDRIVSFEVTYSGGGGPTKPANAVAVGGSTGGAVTLTWDENSEGDDVMVVRYASPGTEVTPTDNTTYTAGTSTLGTGLVVYKGGDETYADTDLTGGATYDYYLYSVHNGTYSSGTKVTGTATCPTWGSIAPSIDGTEGTSATITWNKVPGAAGYLLTVSQTSGGGTSTKTDTITIGGLGITATSYASGNFTAKTFTSDATYAGQVIKNTSEYSDGCIQMRNQTPSGIVSSGSGGTVKSVTITGAKADGIVYIYGSNSPYTTAADLYSATSISSVTLSTSAQTVNFAGLGNYAYIGFKSSKAVYIVSIAIEWTTSSGTTTYYYGSSAGGASAGTWVAADNEWSQTVTGLSAGNTYDYKLEVTGAGTCSANQYSSGTTFSTSSGDIAPSFEDDEVELTGTTGTAVTYQQTASGYPTTMTYSLASGSGATVNSSTGDFSFTPSAAGTYTFRVQASNGVGTPATYDIEVTVAPAKPTITVGTVTANSIAGTVSCESGATVTLKRYATPEAAAAGTIGDSTGVGVTVTVSGSSGSFTDSGRTGCTTYYYKAWVSHNSQTSEASDVKTQATSDLTWTGVNPAPGAVAGTASATFTWGAVAGAAEYRLSVFQGSAGWGLVSGSTTVEAGEYVIAGADDEGIMGAFNSGGFYTHVAATVSDDILTTAVTDALIWVLEYNSTGDYWTIKNKDTGKYVTCGTGTANTLMGEGTDATAVAAHWQLVIDEEGLMYAHSLNESRKYLQHNNDNNTQRFSSYSDTCNDLHLFKLGAATGTVDGGASQSLNEVTVTSGVVIGGLTPETSYSWKLTAVGGTCSPSVTGTVTPLSAPAPAVSVSEVGGSAIGATVDWGSVEIAGNTESGVTKTFRVTNTGNATLSSLGNATLGTGGQGFTVGTMGKSSLTQNDYTDFTVTFTPTAAMSAGMTKTDTVSFTWDGDTYTFAVTATVPAATLTATAL